MTPPLSDVREKAPNEYHAGSREVQDRLGTRRIQLEVTTAAREKLAELGYDPAFGARPLKRVIQREVADRLASALLEGTIADGSMVVVDAGSSGISVETDPPARCRGARLPARGHEPVFLERAEDAVEVAHVDARLARQGRQRLEQLVAVRRPLAEEQEERRLAETLDSGADAPVPGAHHAPATGAAAASRPHTRPTCKTHM